MSNESDRTEDGNGGTRPFNWGLTPQNGDEQLEQPHEDKTEALADSIAAASGMFMQVPETFAVSELPTSVIPTGEAERPVEPIGSTEPERDIVDPHTVPATQEPSEKKSRALGWWIGGGVLAVVIVVALVFFGSQISKWVSGGGAAPAPSSATPTAALGPGTYQWDQLFGGECLSPFTGAWQQTYTVVDCSTGHAAQLVYKGTFDATPDAVFPGEEALAGQINALCTRNGIFDVAAATAAGSLQVQGSYPVTAEQWNAGQRNYYCFVNHTDGSNITGSLQGTGPAA